MRMLHPNIPPRGNLDYSAEGKGMLYLSNRLSLWAGRFLLEKEN